MERKLNDIWPKSIKDCTTNKDIFGQINAPLVFWKDPLPIETEWDRVLKMRKEKHPLIKGGKSRKNLSTFNCIPTHHDQYFALGHEVCQYCYKKLYHGGPALGTKYKSRVK